MQPVFGGIDRILVDGMDGIGHSGSAAGIGQAVMRQISVQDNAGAFFYFQGDHTIHGHRGGIEYDHFSAASRFAAKPGAEGGLMAAGLSP